MTAIINPVVFKSMKWFSMYDFVRDTQDTLVDQTVRWAGSWHKKNNFTMRTILTVVVIRVR